jgi:hypothetical protein
LGSSSFGPGVALRRGSLAFAVLPSCHERRPSTSTWPDASAAA